jgi:hypothetical protein
VYGPCHLGPIHLLFPCCCNFVFLLLKYLSRIPVLVFSGKLHIRVSDTRIRAARCAVRQRNRVKHLHPAGLPQPLDVPSIVWFPRINGKSVILAIVDRFSKYAHFMPIGHPYTATSLANVFFDLVVRLHGISESIVSDRDPVFTSKLWTELFTVRANCLRRCAPKTNVTRTARTEERTEAIVWCSYDWLRFELYSSLFKGNNKH